MAITVDGNEAAASVAYRLSEVISIYPITPASPMGEIGDAWASRSKPNLWDAVPEVIEMQSEGGAAGALHGALQGGSLATTFTASQGLLLMLPTMYKMAGELLPSVIHVAARSLATHALSIFGDHSDVMSARSTGFAMLSAASVQEAHDFALVSHAASLRSRVPFLHFFDGFRTSHEVAKIKELSDDDLRAMISDDDIFAFRGRKMTPDAPVLRGSAQNPDVFFQAREAINQIYDDLYDTVLEVMDELFERTGRRYHPFDYVGHPEATRVMVIMGSGVGAAEEATEALVSQGEKVGLLKVRLYRPFSPQALVAALPPSTLSLGVLDRTKEPGSVGEPLYTDIVAALAEETAAGGAAWDHAPGVYGGRYGLSSKEFTPAMAAAVFTELAAPQPRRHFTVGITDDVTHISLPVVADLFSEPADVTRAVFYGLGSDGTVGANKNTVKIIGEETDLFAQGYFVYDSRKAGSTTTSHVRMSPRDIQSTYLISEAGFVGVHQFGFLETLDVLEVAEPGATILINSPYPASEVWEQIPFRAQEHIVNKGLEVHVIDAAQVARSVGLGGRVNTILQACFFSLAGILPGDTAVEAMKGSVRKSYAKFGDLVVERNEAAIDAAVDHLERVDVPGRVTAIETGAMRIPSSAPDFVQRVTQVMLEGKGDLLPVSAMPIDGTFPTGTTKYEKRSIATSIPVWEPSLCIDCAKCVMVCPHAAIRVKVYGDDALADAPEGFLTKEWSGREFRGSPTTIAIAPDDCTGCGVCVDVCPAISKEQANVKALGMVDKMDILELARAQWDFFDEIPLRPRLEVRPETVKGSQVLEPLMEFSGACAGCGETPYLKLLSQLYGDRLTVANATGCSSIYGGNLPTTPWTKNADGRGPAWINSLFEDNAEFGLGMRLALDQEQAEARSLVRELQSTIGPELVDALLAESGASEQEVADQRQRVSELKEKLGDDARSARLATVADALVHKTVWIVGGDGWAYDIGFGGLDHVLSTGKNVNILVLDTEVYSNTGGQASKATPRAAVAKFASGGKRTGKKDLGMIATAYGGVYVAQIALGANNTQTVKAFTEAESFDGPSLIIAYSQCIAHGIDMATGMTHQKEAVDSGYWPLYRFDPRLAADGKHPFHLDSRAPSKTFKEFARSEARYAMLERIDPDAATALFRLAQEDIDARWELYEQLADVDRHIPEDME